MTLPIYLIGGFLLGCLIGYVKGDAESGCAIACIVPVTFFLVANVEFSFIDPEKLNSTASLAILFYTAYAAGTGIIGFFLGRAIRRKI
ncbi:hypothetical protein HUO12_03065 [Altererythrobacter sp. JGD-16]|uniref:Uncharacterized protein n=1 Tax=Altererythrobacter lutimaris TaxID=2743979 RepID=A0A850HGJ3_9SPHN|nr:hypothetical protein [Altererythrobacter lutimaris]